eukprot:575964-Amorphochlora_amoeboformis.AAC.1
MAPDRGYLVLSWIIWAIMIIPGVVCSEKVCKYNEDNERYSSFALEYVFFSFLSDLRASMRPRVGAIPCARPHESDHGFFSMSFSDGLCFVR